MRRTLPWGLLAFFCSIPLAIHGHQPEAKPGEGDRDEKTLRLASVKTDNASLLEFFGARTLSDEQRDRAELLVTQLGASAFKDREHALHDLIAMGPAVRTILRAGLAHPDNEVQRRCELALDKVTEADKPLQVRNAAIRLIASRRLPRAVDTLLAFLPWADSEDVADETRGALAVLGLQDGKADPRLVAALTDKNPVRRAAAGQALLRGGANDQLDAVKKLLGDADVGVRWRVGLAVANTGDKSPVPALIQMIPDLSRPQAVEVEDLLCYLRGGPLVSLGSSAADRNAFREGWEKWWKEHEGTLDAAALKAWVPIRGYTTMVLLDESRVLEVDSKNEVRWQIDNLKFPLDIQILGPNRILIAEYQGDRVTERNFQGEILWKQVVEQPQMAQRLPNGNTLVSSKSRLVEFDAKGKEVFSFYTRAGEGFLKSCKTADGDIVCLVQEGIDGARFVRISPKGKTLNTFQVPVRIQLFGGRLESLANGHVLVPLHGDNRVVEYDAKDNRGKVLWEVPVVTPIVATRLRNGNTLVTSMDQRRAVEFDPAGHEVWYSEHPTRVTRALRR
jgi:hypothetical protein